MQSGNTDITNHSYKSLLYCDSHDPQFSNIFRKVIKDAHCQCELTVKY